MKINDRSLHSPFPVPCSEKNNSSAAPTGRLSLTGMQYLMNIISSKKKHILKQVTHQIACSRSDNFFFLEYSLIKPFTISNSEIPPASKPQESWKINPGL